MKSILVVDDVEQSRYMLSVLLEGKGYKVTQACNGEEALDYARQVPPELIVSDILMPVMDGFKLCRKWKTAPKLRNIPFIFYTATYTNSEDKDLALSLGADRFLLKPLDPEQLMIEIVETIQSGVTTNRQELTTNIGNVEYYEQYSKILVRKLEQKVEKLTEINIRLQKKEKELERQLKKNIRGQGAIGQSEE